MEDIQRVREEILDMAAHVTAVDEDYTPDAETTEDIRARLRYLGSLSDAELVTALS